MERSALEKLESDVPALPLNHGEVDPDGCKGFKKWDTFIASEVVAFGKTRIQRELASDFFATGT